MNLEYTDHINTCKTCKNISSKLALLKRIKRYLTIDYRKIFYNGYILPLLDYCIVVWSNTSKSNILRIHRLQKYAARIILDAQPDAPSKPLFDEQNCLILYEMKHKPSPSYLHDLFPVPNSTSHLLRSNTITSIFLDLILKNLSTAFSILGHDYGMVCQRTLKMRIASIPLKILH